MNIPYFCKSFHAFYPVRVLAQTITFATPSRKLSVGHYTFLYINFSIAQTLYFVVEVRPMFLKIKVFNINKALPISVYFKGLYIL